MKIVYVTFGSAQFHVQARLSILSALNYCRPEQVAVVTDSPAAFTGLAGQLLTLTPAQIAELRGPMNFVHRVKIASLLLYQRQSPEAFVYVDSDSYWLANPLKLADRLTREACLMENFEGVISPQYFGRLDRFLTSRQEALARDGYGFTQRRRDMHIAGLIGFPPLPHREGLLQEVLAFTDYLTLHFPWQTEWAEQYAFSSLLAERQGLTTAPGFINHYWGINWEVQALLSQRPDFDLTELARSPAAFNHLLAQARELLQNPAYRRQLRQRKLKRSFQKRLGVLRALFLRNFACLAKRDTRPLQQLCAP